MSISDKTIEQLQAAVETKVLTIDGRSYSTRPVFDNRKQESIASVLEIATLTGVVDYVTANPDHLKFGPTAELTGDERGGFVHVLSETEVRVVSQVFGEFRQRETNLSAKFKTPTIAGFAFGSFQELEWFIVCLQSLFEPTNSSIAILKVLGNLRDETVKNFSDDGMTQTVNARTGMVLAKEVPVPNPISLTPYRTFCEVTQPESLFVLRLKQQDGPPKVALFEADGGAWKLEAIQSIKEYLVSKLPGVTVIA